MIRFLHSVDGEGTNHANEVDELELVAGNMKTPRASELAQHRADPKGKICNQHGHSEKHGEQAAGGYHSDFDEDGIVGAG